MATTITGISSMATKHLLADLAHAYASAFAKPVAIESTGGVAALRRIEEGEAFDIVVLAANAIERLAEAGRIDPASRVNIARSGVAVAVKAGAPHPSIDDESAVRHAVLAARSIGYSTGPSGAYLMRLFERWGVLQEVSSRIVQAPPGVAVGGLIAQGEVELGFQQMSELIGVAGIDVVGPLPADIQTLTVFQGAVCTAAREPVLARSLLAYLSSPEAGAVMQRHGMEPVR
ncbi:substrate-binding domain-containing protein [Caballeronia sp. HLA56]